MRTVRAVDVDTSGNSILREAEDNNNNSCKCGIVDMLFLPPVIDYSLEKSCAGCIEEERILVGRVMSLKKAIEEDGEEDGDGDGELVPIGMRVEGRNNPGSSTEANGDGTTSSTFALTGARCIPVGGGGGVSEPSCLPSEIGKPVAPATGPGYISVPVFLPIDDDVDERRRRERVGGEAFTSSEKFVNYPQALVNDRSKWFKG